MNHELGVGRPGRPPTSAPAITEGIRHPAHFSGIVGCNRLDCEPLLPWRSKHESRSLKRRGRGPGGPHILSPLRADCNQGSCPHGHHLTAVCGPVSSCQIAHPSMHDLDPVEPALVVAGRVVRDGAVF